MFCIRAYFWSNGVNLLHFHYIFLSFYFSVFLFFSFVKSHDTVLSAIVSYVFITKSEDKAADFPYADVYFLNGQSALQTLCMKLLTYNLILQNYLVNNTRVSLPYNKQT